LQGKYFSTLYITHFFSSFTCGNETYPIQVHTPVPDLLFVFSRQGYSWNTHGWVSIRVIAVYSV